MIQIYIRVNPGLKCIILGLQVLQFQLQILNVVDTGRDLRLLMQIIHT